MPAVVSGQILAPQKPRWENNPKTVEFQICAGNSLFPKISGEISPELVGIWQFP
jgi:hypothetical protein